jgi:hypothetical protein
MIAVPEFVFKAQNINIWIEFVYLWGDVHIFESFFHTQVFLIICIVSFWLLATFQICSVFLTFIKTETNLTVDERSNCYKRQKTTIKNQYGETVLNISCWLIARWERFRLMMSLYDVNVSPSRSIPTKHISPPRFQASVNQICIHSRGCLLLSNVLGLPTVGAVWKLLCCSWYFNQHFVPSQATCPFVLLRFRLNEPFWAGSAQIYLRIAQNSLVIYCPVAAVEEVERKRRRWWWYILGEHDE